MNDTLAKQVRKEQVQRDLTLLEDSIINWLEHRRDEDKDEQGYYVGRHQTQLATLQSVLLGAVQASGRLLATLDPSDSALDRGAFYDECREYDQVMIWLRRIWEYYKAKFDQRDDTRTGPFLKAADEVVWSCYRQVFIRAITRVPALKQGPTPLTFIEPQYSPAAWQSDKPLPPTLRLNPAIDLGDQIAQVESELKGLPIAVLQLPPWCLEAPWWLVYIGHEVGHHIQHDLGLVAHFMEGLRRAASAHVPRPRADQWGKWGEEVFADIFSVLVMGPWAVWALTEVLWSATGSMVKEGGDVYPPPVVRLDLVSKVADTLGIGGTAALHELPLTELTANENIKRDMNVVNDAVKFALAALPGNLGTLPDLCRLNPAVFHPNTGKVAKLALALRGLAPLAPNRDLETARLLTSGSLNAWSTIAMLQDDTKREDARHDLIERTITAIRKSAPLGTRAGPSGDLPGKGEELAQALLQASRKRRP